MQKLISINRKAFKNSLPMTITIITIMMMMMMMMMTIMMEMMTATTTTMMMMIMMLLLLLMMMMIKTLQSSMKIMSVEQPKLTAG